MFALADSCVKQFKSKENAPSELEIEYSLTLDRNAEIWKITLGKTSNIRVNMKWLNT